MLLPIWRHIGYIYLLVEVLLIAHNLLRFLHHLLHLLARLTKQPEVNLTLFHFGIEKNLNKFFVHIFGHIDTSSLELDHVLKVLIRFNV